MVAIQVWLYLGHGHEFFRGQNKARVVNTSDDNNKNMYTGYTVGFSQSALWTSVNIKIYTSMHQDIYINAKNNKISRQIHCLLITDCTVLLKANRVLPNRVVLMRICFLVLSCISGIPEVLEYSIIDNYHKANYAQILRTYDFLSCVKSHDNIDTCFFSTNFITLADD